MITMADLHSCGATIPETRAAKLRRAREHLNKLREIRDERLSGSADVISYSYNSEGIEQSANHMTLGKLNAEISRANDAYRALSRGSPFAFHTMTR